MGMTRRDLFKATAVAAAGVAVAGCTTETGMASTAASSALMAAPKGNRVVVIGAGFGGLTLAKNLRKLHAGAEVVVLEKNDLFMACPFSNTYLGGLEGVTLGDLTHDYYGAAQKYGYTMIQTEVTGIDRGSKTVHSTNGAIGYDLLVMAPGIAYNYESQFKNWDTAKAESVRRAAPPAMIPGSEHLALKRQLENMDDGDVVITVPEGKYRCPPAPYERACMIAAWMDAEDIQGKVRILDTVPKPRAKAAAFLEAFKDFHSNRIEFIGETEINDVDTSGKTITYTDINTDKKHTMNYQVLNLIPKMKANPVIAMSGVKTNGWGAAVLKGAGFDTVTDKDVYVVGDAVAHRIPPSGQTANWAAKRAAHQIAARMMGHAYDATKGLPWKAANVCYSMVQGNSKTEEGIMVTHTFSFTGKDLKGKGSVPKDPRTGKFHSSGVGKATREWFRGIKADLFA